MCAIRVRKPYTSDVCDEEWLLLFPYLMLLLQQVAPRSRPPAGLAAQRVSAYSSSCYAIFQKWIDFKELW
jgi:hypothetical protein